MCVSKYSYKIIKASWGIAIDITGKLLDWSSNNKKYEDINIISSDLAVHLPQYLTDLEKKNVCEGLGFFAESVNNHSKYAKTLVVLESIEYNPCDYQEEGLTAAMICWMASAMGIDVPKIDVSYDKALNKYIFDYIK